MLRNLIVLPDGTEIFSGVGAVNAIQNTTITDCVNSETELTLGSVCCNALEAKFFTPEGNLCITAGTEVTLYKVDDLGTRTKVGLFTLEKPERPSANTYKIIAYDRVSRLDRDLSAWVEALDGWPYTLLTFAQMVCEECALTLVNTEIPNGDFLINEFSPSEATGRRLMGWIGQLAARFCRATVDGDIEFAWYEDSGVTLSPSGDRYYFSLKYEDYQVEKIDAVLLRLADSEYGALWPEAAEGANCYVISNNPLIAVINDDIKPYLQVIQKEISGAVYTPCKVAIPAALDIRAGQTVRIVDRNGQTLTAYVMTKTQKGQKDILECTGSARRDSPTALNNVSSRDYADSAANAAVKRQTQLDIFNKLTNNGSVQGLLIEKNGQIYVNATYISTGILASKDGKTFYLDLDEGILNMQATSLTIAGKSLKEVALEGLTQEEIIKALTADGAAKGIFLENGQLYINASYINSGELNAALIKAGVLQSGDGETFVLDLDNGTFKMKGSGKFMAPDGKSYITVDGGAFVLYAQDGEDGDFVDIARISFSEDSEGLDYPYILLGHAEESDANHDKIGLIKMFANGIYVGNSVPRLSTGDFVGLAGAVGFFVDVQNAKTYNVVGEDMYDAFVAVFA